VLRYFRGLRCGHVVNGAARRRVTADHRQQRFDLADLLDWRRQKAAIQARLGDLAVLAAGFLTAPVKEIGKIKSLLTMVGVTSSTPRRHHQHGPPKTTEKYR